MEKLVSQKAKAKKVHDRRAAGRDVVRPTVRGGSGSRGRPVADHRRIRWSTSRSSGGDTVEADRVSSYGVRRRLFCCLDIIFDLCVEDQRAVMRLSPELVAEMSSLIVPAPLAVVNLRATYLDEIVATDAPGDCVAAVGAHCPVQVVREVF